MSRNRNFISRALGLALVMGVTAGTRALAEESAHKWAFDLQGGSATNLHVPLHLVQGAYDKKLTAHYSTRAYGGGAAPYYALRFRRYFAEGSFGSWLKRPALSIQLLHHKLWLDNRPPEVQEFRMTYGYNFLAFTLSGQLLPKYLRAYLGLAPIIPHPINTVNGLKLANSPKLWPTGQRYVLAGAGLEMGLEGILYFSEQFFANADFKMTGSLSRVPLNEGHATVKQCSFHGNLGLGVAW
jgi:hypothetical protein